MKTDFIEIFGKSILFVILLTFLIIGFLMMTTPWLSPASSLGVQVIITCFGIILSSFMGSLIYCFFCHIAHGHYAFMQDNINFWKSVWQNREDEIDKNLREKKF